MGILTVLLASFGLNPAKNDSAKLSRNTTIRRRTLCNIMIERHHVALSTYAHYAKVTSLSLVDIRRSRQLQSSAAAVANQEQQLLIMRKGLQHPIITHQTNQPTPHTSHPYPLSITLTLTLFMIFMMKEMMQIHMRKI